MLPARIQFAILHGTKNNNRFIGFELIKRIHSQVNCSN